MEQRRPGAMPPHRLRLTLDIERYAARMNEEVTGQEVITQTLRNALEYDRLHHAYLFSGARGVGKTTTVAKLAANFKLVQGLRVGLVTVDTYRIAAVE